MNQFYSACASNLLKSRLEVSSSFGRVVVRRVLTSLFNLPLHSRLMGLRRAVISAVGGAFLSNKGGFLCDRRELYTEIELGLITKISFSALRRLVSCCILRRKFLKHRVAVKLTSKFASRFRHNSVTKGRVVSFLKFLSRFYGGSLGPHFSSLIKRMSWSQLMVTSSKFDSLSLFLVKRYLLA